MFHFAKKYSAKLLLKFLLICKIFSAKVIHFSSFSYIYKISFSPKKKFMKAKLKNFSHFTKNATGNFLVCMELFAFIISSPPHIIIKDDHHAIKNIFYLNSYSLMSHPHTFYFYHIFSLSLLFVLSPISLDFMQELAERKTKKNWKKLLSVQDGMRWGKKLWKKENNNNAYEKQQEALFEWVKWVSAWNTWERYLISYTAACLLSWIIKGCKLWY